MTEVRDQKSEVSKTLALRPLLLALSLLSSLLLAPCSAEAQQPAKVSRIGYLTADSRSANADVRADAFREGLRELGYVEGKNIVIEWRQAEGKLDRLPALAAELVRLKVDVIVTGGPTATRPVKAATTTIPIVMTQDSDPVGNGFIASLARPRWEHYGTVQPCPGDKRQKTGDPKGGCSQAHSRGGLRHVDQPRQFTIATRDGTRRRRARRADSIPGHTRFEGY